MATSEWGELYYVTRIADGMVVPLTCRPEDLEEICKRDGYELVTDAPAAPKKGKGE